MNYLASLVVLAALIVQASATQPLQHKSKPSLLWNQAIRAPPRNDNVVQISPDDKWVYVTSEDGTLSKLNPENGDYVGVYTPEQRRDDGNGGLIPENAQFQWIMYGGKGISFHMAEEEGSDDTSYLIYWVFDVPPPSTGMTPSSRVISLRHDEGEEFDVLWTKYLPGGSIAGTPVIGTEGTFVYLTMDAIPAPPAPAPAPPTASPVAATTNLPTLSPAISPAAPDDGTGSTTDAPTPSPVVAMQDNMTTTVSPTESPTTVIGSVFGRRLQLNRSARFVILSHALDGQMIYEFDSRDELSIQKQSFAPVGIARNPLRGNYNGGEGNTHDVVMWGSLNDGGAQQGETMLFQLPQEFDGFNASDVDTSQFQVRVLESVSWTTETGPTFSASGLDVYFAISGNRFTGWNKGRKFDVVSNLGEIPLPPQTEAEENDSAGRPIVLANNDELLLLGSSDYDRYFGVQAESGGIDWLLSDLGTNSIFTATRLSPDGTLAYFGKKSAVHAVNLTDGSQLWGEDGYEHPSNAASDRAMVADFSISSTGEYLYYARTGSSISAIQIAQVIPTESPTATPSSQPTRITASPSVVPSIAASASPSKSAMPSTTTSPTLTSSPSVDPDYIPPSTSPTSSSLPSMSPSTSRSESPSKMALEVPSSPPTKDPETASPVIDQTTGEAPSRSPTIATIDANPPSSAVEAPDGSSDGESSTLSTTAIIGIAVGGGLGLLLMLGSILYICKKRSGEDDGVDTEWQRSNNAGATTNAGRDRDQGATFQYGEEVEEVGQNHQRWGEGGELRW